LKTFLMIFMLAALAFSAYAQENETVVYQVKAVYQNSDINQKAIQRYKKSAARWGDPDEVLKLFKPIKGKYKVILFMETSYGLSFRDTKEIFHNILILKVAKNNEILDGLQYLLEWAEPPLAVRLFRVTKTGVKLQKGLQLSQLHFKAFEAGLEWTPGGVTDNLYNFKEIF
jgi:hypothetical protein